LIERAEEGSKGRYVLRRDGHEAVLTYSRASDALVIADGTEVPEALRGQGIADRLAEAMARDARTQGFRIVPLCPFVNAWRRKHPDWADAFEV
jgi:predicted GNAT family acetyltransferase